MQTAREVFGVSDAHTALFSRYVHPPKVKPKRR